MHGVTMKIIIPICGLLLRPMEKCITAKINFNKVSETFGLEQSSGSTKY